MFGGPIGKLKSRDTSKWRRAIKELQERPRANAVPYLLPLLLEQVYEIPRSTRDALDACDRNWRKSQHARDFVPKLLAIAHARREDGEWRDAMAALETIGDGRAADTYAAMLRAQPECYEALRGLVKLKDARAFAAVETAVRAGSSFLHSYFGDIGDRRAIPILNAAMKAHPRDCVGPIGVFADPSSAQPVVDHMLAVYAAHETNSDKAYPLRQAAEALTAILRKGAGAVPEGALRAITGFQDLAYWVETAPAVCSFSAEGHDDKLDLSGLRQLAKQELARRGVR